jgi:quercetin dioxygenase-like cupin family protein
MTTNDTPYSWRATPSTIEPMIVEHTQEIDGRIDVRVLSRDPFVIENTFAPGTRVIRHAHTSDTLYVFRAGEFTIEGEGVFRAGDVRFVRGGAVYGPEWAGDEGATLLIISYGSFGTDWDHAD